MSTVCLTPLQCVVEAERVLFQSEMDRFGLEVSGGYAARSVHGGYYVYLHTDYVPKRGRKAVVDMIREATCFDYDEHLWPDRYGDRHWEFSVGKIVFIPASAYAPA